MKMPLVSIITPSYNQGRFLEQTIRCVLDQTYPNIEYIVIDGGSKDESVAIIKKYADRIAYWHSKPDKGFCDAIKQGFDKSTGQILAYLNSDDLIAPDAVEKAVSLLNSKPDTVMVYGNRVCIDEDGQLLYVRPSLPWLARSPYIGMTIGQESCFWRRETYFKVGGMNTSLRFGIDYDLFSRITLAGKVVHKGDVWGFFRKHSSSKTMTQYQTLGKQENRIIQTAYWGGAVKRYKWVPALLFIRFYTLVAMPFVSKPKWPSSLPPVKPKSFLQRFGAALQEDSFLKKLANKFLV